MGASVYLSTFMSLEKQCSMLLKTCVVNKDLKKNTVITFGTAVTTSVVSVVTHNNLDSFDVA